MNELGFRRTSSTLALDPETHRQRAVARDESGIGDAASIFQLAYTLYLSRRYAAR
jgi:hypothetical protein